MPFAYLPLLVHSKCMTPVRHQASSDAQATPVRKRSSAGRTAGAKRSAQPTGSSRRVTSRESGSGRRPSEIVQVRLQTDEAAALRGVMRALNLSSTSDALREGIRLLIREAGDIAAANEIATFYGSAAAPLPDGVIEATEEELAAADAAEW